MAMSLSMQATRDALIKCSLDMNYEYCWTIEELNGDEDRILNTFHRFLYLLVQIHSPPLFTFHTILHPKVPIVLQQEFQKACVYWDINLLEYAVQYTPDIESSSVDTQGLSAEVGVEVESSCQEVKEITSSASSLSNEPVCLFLYLSWDCLEWNLPYPLPDMLLVLMGDSSTLDNPTTSEEERLRGLSPFRLEALMKEKYPMYSSEVSYTVEIPSSVEKDNEGVDSRVLRSFRVEEKVCPRVEKYHIYVKNSKSLKIC